MWKEKLQDTAASHPWLEPHEAIKRKTQAPGMQLVDWYGFTVPKTKKEMFLKQSARREDLLVVGEVDNIHSFFDDYETEWRSNILFDDLDEALRYCEDVRSGFISDIQLHSSFIMYKEPGFKAMPGGGFAGWSENKNTNVKEETTWTNFKFFNNQVKLKVIEKDDRQMYLADCRFMPGSVANGIDLGDQNGISGHMTVFLTEKQYFKAAEQKANGEQINVGLPSTQLKDGKIEVNFYNHESKEAHTIQVNPFAASKANKAAREAFFERKDAEREQGKSLGAKAASARGASEKLDGQTQAAPAKDNLEH